MLSSYLKFKLTATALIMTGLVLAFGITPAVSYADSAVFAAGENGHYVAKLKSADAAVLSQTGATNIEKKFSFSKLKAFQNVYSFDSGKTYSQLSQELAGIYDYLEIDPVVNSHDTVVTPNDPGFTNNELDTNNEWGLAKAKFPAAWSKTTGSFTNIVAVIDTGIDETHSDLSGVAYRDGYDFIRNTAISTGINSDDNGHGTLVSGVIAAVPNNGKGIAGTNWQITLMPVKALDSGGSGTASSVAESIVWAADHSANIINMSLGGIGFSHDTTLANAISYAYNKNVVIIAAAGNDAASNGGNLDTTPVFPICDDNGQNMIIGVTASDLNDIKPDFANYGKVCVDVAAPGKKILSTINHDPLSGRYASNAYAFASGTSLAVPFVTGEAALIKSKNPSASNAQIRDAIIASADNIDDFNLSQCGGGSCRGLLGAGRINAAKALATDISLAVQINEGDVVRVGSSDPYYYISGSKRHLISPFVKEQRFPNATIKTVAQSDLNNFPEGDYATPLDGTLVKLDADAAVYYMSKGLRLPVTYQVFLLRGFNFADVHTLSYTEVNSWLLGSFLAPPEGTLLRTGKNPTVYWVVGGVLHPINYNFYVSRGLQVFPVVYVADQDIASFSKGDAYIN